MPGFQRNTFITHIPIPQPRNSSCTASMAMYPRIGNSVSSTAGMERGLCRSNLQIITPTIASSANVSRAFHHSWRCVTRRVMARRVTVVRRSISFIPSRESIPGSRGPAMCAGRSGTCTRNTARSNPSRSAAPCPATVARPHTARSGCAELSGVDCCCRRRVRAWPCFDCGRALYLTKFNISR